jgi:dolichol kinase
MTLGQSIWFLLYSYSSVPASLSIPRRWNDRTNEGKSGLTMSIVMIPALLHALSCHHGSKWISYAKMASLLAAPQIPTAVALCAIAITLDDALQSAATISYASVFVFLEWMMTKNLSGTFTYGEMRSINLLLSIVLTEWMQTIANDRYSRISIDAIEFSFSNLYPLVALSGSVSCCMVCAATVIVPLIWWLRIILNVVGPLVMVEIALWTTTAQSTTGILPVPFHRAFFWLFGFLGDNENGYPRWLGLLYWVGVLALVSIPTFRLLSLPTSTVSVVVTRKWFHLIAILLFGPITWQFPQLLSLGYAVATCVLLVIETVRRDIPGLQSFYVTFLDDRKDDGGNIIVSHIFLILGCAAPLWISQAIVNDKVKTQWLLLGEFGVIIIGVGDAMGAVVGKGIGKYRWGGNRRTLEGSLAMFLSTVIAGALTCRSNRDVIALLAAASFSTILEAFTLQLDNLALPLAGSAIILLFMPDY